MKIIPAIDIINGQCVRLSQGDYSTRKIYDTDPLAVAQRFEDAGIAHLHLVDLDGAKQGKIINWNVLENIAANTTLQIDFGGGIKTNKDIEIAFDSGAAQVTCGSIAVKNAELVYDWIDKYGSEKLILGADVKNKMVAVNGWTETTSMSVDNLLKQYLTKGLKTVICTDIATDGMLQGPNAGLYKEIIDSHPSIRLIASGGVSAIDDLRTLQDIGLYGAIVGKAIYENKISLEELKTFINA
jgi:phosphoribosylformimino-5-aminoimidazole carboxamide ribotide isomerase